jgi:hypothetical protein
MNEFALSVKQRSKTCTDPSSSLDVATSVGKKIAGIKNIIIGIYQTPLWLDTLRHPSE